MLQDRVCQVLSHVLIMLSAYSAIIPHVQAYISAAFLCTLTTHTCKQSLWVSQLALMTVTLHLQTMFKLGWLDDAYLIRNAHSAHTLDARQMWMSFSELTLYCKSVARQANTATFIWSDVLMAIHGMPHTVKMETYSIRVKRMPPLALRLLAVRAGTRKQVMVQGQLKSVCWYIYIYIYITWWENILLLSSIQACCSCLKVIAIQGSGPS